MDPNKIYNELKKIFPKVLVENIINLSLVALNLRPAYTPEYIPESILQNLKTKKQKEFYDKYFDDFNDFDDTITRKGETKKYIKILKKYKNSDIGVGKILGFGPLACYLSKNVDIRIKYKYQYSYSFLYDKNDENSIFITIILCIKNNNVKKSKQEADKYIKKLEKSFYNGFFKYIPKFKFQVRCERTTNFIYYKNMTKKQKTILQKKINYTDIQMEYLEDKLKTEYNNKPYIIYLEDPPEKIIWKKRI
jgi:hypothetical protein